ncbi:cardiolipin synthetase [Aquimixticola soesokkakensis]|uniref:Phospholipase D n=1 Tax=Aquimixticola soesokkakensis TaxID=1519096 RepID=A0A1Y5RGF4_9RHOB|nr:phospholipase D-like domain-containing protein [Aquimixticola soesokkakensis]SLN14285.1 cardiolipin synthetase [Aquimixticola soesokkakensis]
MKITPYLTAGEAYPAFERAVVAARHRIDAGFRVFDPMTRLRSDEARVHGDTWYDLLAAKLEQGVEISLAISDFDPIMARDLHQSTWAAIRRLTSLTEYTDSRTTRLHLRALLHPAKVGLYPRLFFAPATRAKLRHQIEEIAQLAPRDQARVLSHSPGLRPYLARDEDGGLAMKRGVIPQLHPVSNHHKLAVIDDAVTYIGGLDLDERRYDTKQHDQAAQQTWHDVQLMIHDPALATSARQYLEDVVPVTSGKKRPTALTGLLRTQSRPRHNRLAMALSPHSCTRELLDAHLAAIARAEQFIYIETQFFREAAIARALVKAAQSKPDLHLVMIVPAAPEDVAFEDNSGPDARFGEHLMARCTGDVRAAFGKRAAILSPVQPRNVQEHDNDFERAQLQDAPIVYVHAKVSIFDGREAIVASGNLNGRSMRWDSEVGVRLTDAGVVGDLQHRLMAHWLPEHAPADCFEPATATRAWADIAAQNALLDPPHRRGFLMPYVARPARRFGLPIPFAPKALV